MKLWLDDLRQPPDTTWEWAANFSQVTFLLDKFGAPDLMSFDHDLGITIDGDFEMNGYEIIQFISNHRPLSYPKEVEVHSSNPVGAENILKWDEWFRRVR